MEESIISAAACSMSAAARGRAEWWEKFLKEVENLCLTVLGEILATVPSPVTKEREVEQILEKYTSVWGEPLSMQKMASGAAGWAAAALSRVAATFWSSGDMGIS